MKNAVRFRPRRVLVIDDDTALTQVLKLNLEATGDYEVCVVNCNSRAREAALAFHPDIILLDIIMPLADGGEVANQLRRDPLLSDIPILFISAIVSTSESAERPIRRGGEWFLAKPARRETVIHSIERLLQRAA